VPVGHHGHGHAGGRGVRLTRPGRLRRQAHPAPTARRWAATANATAPGITPRKPPSSACWPTSMPGLSSAS
jgi:hypothetical protein